MKVNAALQENRRRGRPPVDRRDEILDVAQQLYERIGFEKTTMSDVARELGMSPANLYRSFANRQAIDEAVAQRRLSQIEDAAWAVARSALNDPAAAMVALAVTVHRESRDLLLVDGHMNQLCAVAARENWPPVERYMEGLHGAVRHVISEGQRLGIFARGDVEPLAAGVVHAFTRVWHPYMLEMNASMDLETDAERLGRMIVAALRLGLNNN